MSEASDDVSPLSNGPLCAGTCEKIPRTFAKRATTSLRYLMVPCVQVPVRKFGERLPTEWAYLV